MKRQMKIKFIAEPEFEPVTHHEPPRRDQSGPSARQRIGSSQRMVLVILPDGKVVRRPEPRPVPAAVRLPGKTGSTHMAFDVRSLSGRTVLPAAPTFVPGFTWFERAVGLYAPGSDHLRLNRAELHAPRLSQERDPLPRPTDDGRE